MSAEGGGVTCPWLCRAVMPATAGFAAILDLVSSAHVWWQLAEAEVCTAQDVVVEAAAAAASFVDMP